MNRMCAIAVYAVMAVCFTVSAKTIVVPKDYADIQKAIDNAAGGDTVFVTNGMYKETIEMRDSIVLCGEDRERAVIVGVENKPVVTVADNSTVSTLWIKGGSTGILCPNKLAVIEKCIVSDNRETGIHCLISLPVIRNNVVYRNKMTGILCQGVRSLRGGLEHNVIAENEYCGLNLDRKTEIMVINNVFAYNKQYGIFSSQDARRSTILSNDFWGNRNPFNKDANAVKTNNLFLDPAFEPKAPSSWDYLRSKISPLRGLGREGKNIGLHEED